MEPFDWLCPFCQKHATITPERLKDDYMACTISSKKGPKILRGRFIICPNPKCREYTLKIALHDYTYLNGDYRAGKLIKTWELVPESDAKVLPEYIPKAIQNDYYEACLIKNLSPKSSATLARRCLQGMIRDFWNVKKDRLIDEINALKNLIDQKVWKAICAVKDVGNIGAHMEKDIDLIINVDPEEAQLLINLIEKLIEEWYVKRHERDSDMDELIELAQRKKEERTQIAN